MGYAAHRPPISFPMPSPYPMGYVAHVRLDLTGMPQGVLPLLATDTPLGIFEPAQIAGPKGPRSMTATPSTTVTTPVIVPIDTPTLGDRSYLAHDGLVAVVIDPQRDIDRVLHIAAEEHVRITHVFETHIHNDYVTGGLALAQATGASYHVNAADEVSYDRTPIVDGDVIEVSPTMRVRAISTPGHTFTHLVLRVRDRAAARRRVRARRRVHRRVAALRRHRPPGPARARPHPRPGPPPVRLGAPASPTSCPNTRTCCPPTASGRSARPAPRATATASTIGTERRQNPALTQDEEQWVADTLAGLDAYPAYYAHMAPANAAGPMAPDLTAPETADKDTLAARIAAGEWVVDLRTRTAFAAGHVTGTLNFGLDGQFATYLGWLIPWGTPLTLLGDSAGQVAEAQRELVRIGIDHPAGAATGTPDEWTDEALGTFERAVFADLAHVRHHRSVAVLDVRRATEFDDGHIDGALNVPLHELLGRVGEVPAGEVWVHCAGGYRASIAASVLASRGIRVVAVDDSFGENAAGSGLPITRAA